MPPALPRPPASTWDLMATGPISAAAAAASSGVRATRPRGTGRPAARKMSLAMNSNIFMVHPPLCPVSEAEGLQFLDHAADLVGRPLESRALLVVEVQFDDALDAAAAQQHG